MCCARASSARLPRSSTGGLEVSMGSPACAAAALAVGGAALVAMRPALKTGQLKLGAGAARGSPRLAPPRVGAAFSLVPSPRRRRSGVLVCYSRRPRPPRPQNPPSFSVPCDVSVPSAAPRWVSHRRACEERAWRQMRAKSITPFLLCLLKLAERQFCTSYTCRAANPNTYARQRVKPSHIHHTRPFFAALF